MRSATRGQDVDDHQVQQARHHRAVAVVAFRVVGRQVDVAGRRPAASRWR